MPAPDPLLDEDRWRANREARWVESGPALTVGYHPTHNLIPKTNPNSDPFFETSYQPFLFALFHYPVHPLPSLQRSHWRPRAAMRFRRKLTFGVTLFFLPHNSPQNREIIFAEFVHPFVTCIQTMIMFFPFFRTPRVFLLFRNSGICCKKKHGNAFERPSHSPHAPNAPAPVRLLSQLGHSGAC